MKTTNYNRPAIHRKHIKEGKMTERESDRIIEEWKREYEDNENEFMDSAMKCFTDWQRDWVDDHGGYQNDDGSWEI